MLMAEEELVLAGRGLLGVGLECFSVELRAVALLAWIKEGCKPGWASFRRLEYCSCVATPSLLMGTNLRGLVAMWFTMQIFRD